MMWKVGNSEHEKFYSLEIVGKENLDGLIKVGFGCHCEFKI